MQTLSNISEHGIITPNYQIKDLQFDVYWTGDAAPTDNWTSQNATDYAQAIYDFFKKCGGALGIVYTGRISYRSRKASDGHILSSSEGYYTLFSNQTYANMLADNSVARISFDYRLYGTSISNKYALWADHIMRSLHGMSPNGTLTDVDVSLAYNTISS